MPMSTGPIGAGNMTVTRGATFIPKIWSEEVIASYERKVVMGNHVRKMSMKGKKGDTINIPSPIRGNPSLKAPQTQVNVQYATENNVQVVVNRHWEYSMVFEDILMIQAMPSLKRFYTEDAGYRLAMAKDVDLFNLGRSLNGGVGTNVYTTGAFSGGDGTTAYTGSNAAAITDAAIRRTIQRLDDNDVPQDGRVIVVPPAARNTLMGISRFTEQAFTGDAGPRNTIHNGQIGDIYGMQVYVSPNADTTSTGDRVVLMFHEDSFVLADQLSVRSQSQYLQMYLGTLYTADQIYGVQIARPGTAEVPTSGYALIVPA